MERTQRTSLLVAAGVAAGFSGFLGCEGVAPPAGGSSGEGARVRAAFPIEADQALVGVRPFEVTGEGFFAQVRPGLGASLPAQAEEGVRLTLGDGRVVRVWEEGATGTAARAEDAIAYARPAGRSFWTAQVGGVEEWLLVEPEGVRRGAPIATWTVEGGRLEDVGAAVLVTDERGVAMLRITAPHAYAEGGRRVEVDLEVSGDRLAIFADAHQERLLVDPLWSPAGDLGDARSDHTATLLPDGRVVVIGGFIGFGQLQSVEIFDPGSEAWTPAAPMSHVGGGISRHTATLLGDGSILVAGGFGKGPVDAVARFDVAGNTWANRAPMIASRDAHVAVPLQSGNILVVGGFGIPFAEVYDPGTNTWTPTGDLDRARAFPSATLLPDGRVLVAGGDDKGALATAELYDPNTNTFSPTLNDMAIGRVEHEAVLMENGRVLVAGGNGNVFAEIFDPSTDTWGGADSLLDARMRASSAAIGDGLLVVMGGTPDGGETTLDSVEVYSTFGDVWTTDTAMFDARFDHTATRLLDGSVLVAGGIASDFTPLAQTERYLSRLPLGQLCGIGGECNSGFCADGVCCQALCAGECEACSIAEGSASNGACMALDGTPCAGGTCELGTCVPGGNGLPDGAPCGSGGQCESTFCSDGVCCESSCVGACNACSQAMGSSTDGVCVPVSGPPCDDGDGCTQSDSCIDGLCSGDPVDCVPGACEEGGFCTAGACEFTSAPDGTPCPGGTCETGVCNTGKLLGLGEACEIPAQCASDACTDGVCCNNGCGGTCQACSIQAGGETDGMCSPADGVPCPNGVCDQGTCVAGGGLPLGEPCGDGEACESGFCTDGVCCGIACDGDCEACSADAGALVDGECAPVSEGTCDDGDACTQVDSCDAGTCVGSDPVVCEVGTCQIANTCGPSGACVPVSVPDGTPCEGGTCIAGSCLADPDIGSGLGAGSGPGSGPGAGSGAGDGDGDGDGDGNGNGNDGETEDGDGEGGSGCAVSGARSSFDLAWLIGAALAAGVGRSRRRRAPAARGSSD